MISRLVEIWDKREGQVVKADFGCQHLGFVKQLSHHSVSNVILTVILFYVLTVDVPSRC